MPRHHFHAQHVLGNGGKAERCRRKGCASRTRAVVTLSDSFRGTCHAGTLVGTASPAWSSPAGGGLEGDGGRADTGALTLGWGKPKAGGERSLEKHVLFPEDVVYVSPQTGTRQFCRQGQAGAVPGMGSAASCGVHRLSHGIGTSWRLALPRSEFSPWLSPKMVSLL